MTKTRLISPVEQSSEYGRVRGDGAKGIRDHLADDISLGLDEKLRHQHLIMTNVLANLLDNKDHQLVTNQVILSFPP